MKYFILGIIYLAFAPGLLAQEETLFSKGESGGFGGPVVKYMSIRGQGAVLVGGRGGWIIDHSLILGGGGYGVVTEIDAPEGVLPQEGPLDVKFEYVGFEVEYLFDPMSLVHGSLYTFVGVGDTYYVKDVGPVSRSNAQVTEKAYMFVLEPAVTV